MADYPRQIFLDDDTEARLISYLDDELNKHDQERDQYVQDLMQWQKDYWAKPTTESVTFPFTGAATLIIPLTAISVETVHARTMTTLFALPQFVSARAVSAEWDDAVTPVEKFLDHELTHNIKHYEPLNNAILEIEKFGTGIAKSGYEKIVKTAIRTIGEQEHEFDVIVKDGATLDAVPGSRFLMPYHARDTQSAPWCGENHSRSPYEVKLLTQSGMFREDTMEKLEGWIASNTGTLGQERKFDRQQEELEHRTVSWPAQIDWVELWMAFNIDGNPDGREYEIIVHYHRTSQTLMSIRYNYNNDLHRPYRKGIYFPVEHRWTGVGICKQNEQFQSEITAQHRQRLDNATLANMRMIKVSKLSGYGPREPIYPGKMWFLDDITQLDTMQMGEIYPSAYQNEQSTLIYSQQRTGVNEVTLGMPQAGTPGTATSDLARIQEGKAKFDFVYRNIKSFVSELIVDIAVNIQQFGPKNISYFTLAENGQRVQEFFTLPAGLIRDGLILEIAASGQQQNKILDRQNWVQIAGLLTQYYTNIIQLVQILPQAQLTNPTLGAVIQKAIGAATEAIRQILESYDVRNIDRIALKGMEALIGPQPPAVQGGNGGLPGTGQAPGMAELAQALQLARTGGAGQAPQF